jgi:hypothetical protein
MRAPTKSVCNASLIVVGARGACKAQSDLHPTLYVMTDHY